MMKHLVTTVSAAALLGACANQIGEPDYFSEQTQEVFGDAVRQNIAAQTVNPDAPTRTGLERGGARAGLAYERYLKDEVEPPAGVETSSTDSSDEGE